MSNKTMARDFLTKNYNWEYYGGHHHENRYTKFVIAYWLYRKFNIDKRKITLSAQIKSGELSREDALKQIKTDPYGDINSDPELNFVLKKLDMNREEFDAIWKEKNHSIYDYPSYLPFIKRNISFTKFVIQWLTKEKSTYFLTHEYLNKK